MKRLLMAAGFVLVAGSAMAETYFVAQTSDGFLNLRSGPGTGHKVIARLYADDAVEFLEERGNWFRVRLSNGEEGWAAERFLYTYSNFDGTVLTVQPTSDGFLNLREGPGASHAIKQRLHHGDRVTVIARKGNWLRVQVKGGLIGWAHSGYLASR